MGNGIFGKWFREFATIVLTQTVQAFLLAIVMTIIISCLAGSGGNEDSVNAAGLLAIIALASFGKIEMLVKNIFGVTSSFGDPSLHNAKGFTMGTAMAFRGIKNISDNLGKSIQGSRLQKQGKAGLANLTANSGNLDANKLNGLNPAEGVTGEGTDAQIATANAVQDQVVKLQTLGDINALTQAIQRLTSATETSNKSDTQSKMKEYQDMINQGKAMKKDAIFESVGAGIGGATGAIVGLAQGEDVIQNTLAGAGVGDTIGKSISQSGTNTKNYRREMQKLTKGIKTPTQQIKDFEAEVAKNISEGRVNDAEAYNAAAADAINKYREDVQKQYEAAAKSMSAAKRPSHEVTSRARAIKSNLSAKNEIKALKNNVKIAQQNIDKNINAGNN